MSARLPPILGLALLVMFVPVHTHGVEPDKQVVDFPTLGQLSPAVRKKAEELLVKVTAESFRDRRKAHEALVELGPTIIPLLKLYADHEEPEVRGAVPDLLVALYDKLAATIPDLKLKLILIEPGSFMMGSPAGEAERGDDKPQNYFDETQHKVTLTSTFWMGQTEVTQAQYKAIMGKNPAKFKGANNPVETVSWHNAVEFCKKLTKREHQAGRLPLKQKYRLPTQAEWEYCCRAGSATAYCYGDSKLGLGDYAWYSNAANTHQIAKKKPNAWGLYDMHGNVWEWCYDWYGDYPNGVQTNPTGPQSGSFRVIRGGGWGYDADACRSAYREANEPLVRRSPLGFRIVREQDLTIKKKWRGDRENEGKDPRRKPNLNISNERSRSKQTEPDPVDRHCLENRGRSPLRRCK